MVDRVAPARPWLLQVASHSRVGAGHVRRVLVLAADLPGRGVMVLDPGSEHWLSTVEAAGLRWAWRGQEPAEQWAGTLADGYEFTPDQFAAWSRIAPPLVVLDDMQAPSPFAALAVNAAPHLTGSALGAVPALLGPDYALVAPAYRRAVNIRGDVGRVVVTFGARDSKNATSLVLDALLAAAPRFAPAVDVVMSATAPHLAVVRAKVAQLPSATLHLDLPDLAGVFGKADLAIGAGGVSLLERMAMGLPSLTVTLSENQELAVAGAARASATLAAGKVEDLTAARLADLIVHLAHDRVARSHMAAAARRLIDGRGASRVAHEMERLSSVLHGRSPSE